MTEELKTDVTEQTTEETVEKKKGDVTVEVKKPNILSLTEFRKQNKIDYPKWNNYLKNGLPTDNKTVNEEETKKWIKEFDKTEKEKLTKWNEENSSRQQRRRNEKLEEKRLKMEKTLDEERTKYEKKRETKRVESKETTTNEES